MGNEDFTPEVGTWLKGREVRPPDSREAARRVATRLPHVRQRSRWLPFPVLPRNRSAPTTPDKDEYSPVPISDEQAPTIIGRTRTMISPVKAIAAGALVFAIAGVMLVGQPFERQPSVPGAQSDAVIGEFVTIESTEELSAFEYDADGNEIIRMTKEANDPRLSGTWTEVWGCRGEPVELCVASVLIENEGGSWLGRADGFGGPPAGFYDFTVLEGQGDYAGLTAIRQVTFRPDQGDTEVLAIYEGELPPLPELPVE